MMVDPVSTGLAIYGATKGAKALGIGQNPAFNAPTAESAKVQQAASVEAAKRRRAAGYQSTILTIPQQQQLKETTGS